MNTAGQSWGLYRNVRQEVCLVTDRRASLPAAITGSMLPFGNGRSYGDSCLNEGGTLLHARGLDRYLSFDPTTGIVQCEAGVLLAEILELAVPQGWFLPVTPGTRFVTVGGAIANDVHGKNHHTLGTFGRHVRELELVRSNGERIACGPTRGEEWFKATVGGLGLTGLITTASIQLRRIANPWMSIETQRFDRLREFFAISALTERDHEYTVAWVDCTTRGERLGRGIFTSANHAPALPDRRPAAPGWQLAVPFTLPLSPINSVTLEAFNTLYFHRAAAGRTQSTGHYQPYFYPLDSIGQWNRIYGNRGFLQYQCVLPPAAAEAGAHELLDRIAHSGQGSFLAVLKQFGEQRSPGMLSFPRSGTTLALDFPNLGKRTLKLLAQLDAVTAAAGGAVYPAKDARMAAEHFQQYFPAWRDFSAFIDPRFSSSFWRRVTG